MKIYSNAKMISILLMTIISPLSALATTTLFPYQGSNYLVTRMGKGVQVVPADVYSSVSPRDGQSLSTDCKEIVESTESLAWAIDACSADPAHPICKQAKLRFKLLGEGRPDDETSTSPEYFQIWNVKQEIPTVQSMDLRTAVAAFLGLASTNIEVKLEEQPRFVGDLYAVYSPDSIAAKIAPVYKIAPHGNAEIYKGGVLTKNKILSCDLLSKKAKLLGQAKTDLNRIERVPDQVVKTTWKAYRGLKTFGELTNEDSPLAQSAVIGYRLAVILPPGTVDVKDPQVGPAALFKSLYEVNNGQPILREFSSMEGLRSIAYPDKIFNLVVDQTWRLQ